MTLLGVQVKNNTRLSIEFLDSLAHLTSYQTHLKLTRIKLNRHTRERVVKLWWVEKCLSQIV